MTNKFFVYGTLKIGGQFSKDFDIIRLSSEIAKLYGFDLFNIQGQFPGIVPGEGIVIGELHVFPREVITEVTKIMDYIEGYSPQTEYDKENFYLRKMLPIVLEDGTEELANVYIFNQKIEKSFKKINSGIWELS